MKRMFGSLFVSASDREIHCTEMPSNRKLENQTLLSIDWPSLWYSLDFSIRKTIHKNYFKNYSNIRFDY